MKILFFCMLAFFVFASFAIVGDLTANKNVNKKAKKCEELGGVWVSIVMLCAKPDNFIPIEE